MPVTIDYYISLNSPWTYMGSALLAEIAKRNGATVNIKPAKFGPIFEKTGGLPLPKRSPERRAYRLMELKRWREVRNIPLVLQPKNSPSDDLAATRLVIAAKLQGKDAHRLATELGRAIWELDEPLGDAAVMAAAAKRAGVDLAAVRAAAPRMPSSISSMSSTRRKRWRRTCSARQLRVAVGEFFWGQDRLEMLERR
jgi:2-hydroxychromene-2-carboxylate isomerase